MTQSFIHTSESNNLYIYDDQRRLSILVHPEFEKAYNQSSDANSYYIKKYEYLREHEFFAKPTISEFATLKEATVRNNIVNTQQIVFETTDLCNLNCTYCALGELYDGNDGRTVKKINTNYAVNLLEYIFNLKPKNKNSKLFISFFGGEPLLNMNFIKLIVGIANQLNTEKELELVYSITTNGTLIHKYIDFLCDNKFSLLISLDGNESSHSYRVFCKNKKNSFHKVIENIDLIQSDYPEYFFTHVEFNAVLHNRNSVKEICEFIYMRYHKIPRISELNTRDVRPENEKLLEKMFQSKWKSEAEFEKENSDLFPIMHRELSSYRELVNFLKYCSINYYISDLISLLHFEEKYFPTNTCTPFSRKIFLTSHNKLLTCERINYQYSMGKVGENIEIDIPEITRQYNFYYEHFKNNCQICYAYRFCGTCMFHLKKLDNVNDKEFVCENFHDQKTFKNKLQRIFSFLEKYPSDFPQILENMILE